MKAKLNSIGILSIVVITICLVASWLHYSSETRFSRTIDLWLGSLHTVDRRAGKDWASCSLDTAEFARSRQHPIRLAITSKPDRIQIGKAVFSRMYLESDPETVVYACPNDCATIITWTGGKAEAPEAIGLTVVLIDSLGSSSSGK